MMMMMNHDDDDDDEDDNDDDDDDDDDDDLVVILRSLFCDFCQFFITLILIFRCFSIYSIEIDITKLIYSSRSIEWCNRKIEKSSKTSFLNNFSIFRKHVFCFLYVFDVF